jgi:hypothetical protein
LEWCESVLICSFSADVIVGLKLDLELVLSFDCVVAIMVLGHDGSFLLILDLLAILGGRFGGSVCLPLRSRDLSWDFLLAL